MTARGMIVRRVAMHGDPVSLMNAAYAVPTIPPLQGEGGRVATGWGQRFDKAPHPASRCSATLPLQGRDGALP